MRLLILENVYFASVALGGASGAAVAMFVAILPYHLDTFVFLGWCFIRHVEFHKLGADATVGEGFHLHHFVQLLLADFVDLANGAGVARLQRHAVHFYLAGTAGIAGLAACFVETHAPQPFVDTNIFLVHGRECKGETGRPTAYFSRK